MRFLRGFLPNLTIALNISLLVIIYLDLRNPMMGFLAGTPFLVLAALCVLCSIASAVQLYGDWRRIGGQKGRFAKNGEKASEPSELE